jgi:hypothetical protein
MTLFENKLTWPRRIDGSPNFRRVPLELRPVRRGDSSPSETDFVSGTREGKWACGR